MHPRRLILPLLLALTPSLLADTPKLQTATTKPAPPKISATLNDRATGDLVEYLSRKSALKPDDLEARLSLARWAISKELFSQAADVAQETLDKDPDSRPAWTILQQVDQAIPLPDEPDTAKDLIAEFNKRFKRTTTTPAQKITGGGEFTTRNSRHFLLCYDTTDTYAAARGAALEKSYEAFMFYFNMNKIRPVFLQKRLVVVLFKERTDYLAYAKDTEGADLGWAAGYYSQRTNRSAFYDDSSSPAAESVEKQVDKLKDRLKELNTQIQTAKDKSQPGLARNLSDERNKIASAISTINNRVDNALGLMNSVKTAHEAAHQLAFNTGIQKRLVEYPLWFSEGLACSFELEDRTGKRGPTVLNTGRIAILKEALKKPVGAAGAMIPLEQFITEPQPTHMDENTLSIFYAEGWALFHYLYKTNRAGMEKYLLAYQALTPQRHVTAEQRKKLFTDAFTDDFHTLEKKFNTYLKDLPTRPPQP